MADSGESKPVNKASSIYDNILDQYDQTTYHFRFFMSEEMANPTIPPPGAFKSSGDNLPPSATIGSSTIFLLAETGSSRVSIDDVNISSIPVSTNKTKTSVLTEVSFDINEPSSVTFFDDLSTAADHLCINNLTKCTYYLELTFRGRSATSSDYRIGKDNLLGDKKWVWPIIIKNIETSINASGATYSVVGYPYNEVGYSNNYGSISTDITVPSAKSVGDVLQFIAKKINDPPKLAENADGKSIAHPNIKAKNRVVFDLSLWKPNDLLFVSSDGDIRNRAKEMSNIKYNGEASDGAKSFTFSKGTTYTSIIDMCMALTNFASLETEKLSETIENEIKNMALEKDKEETRKKLETKVIKKLYKIHARSANITPDSAQTLVGTGVLLPAGKNIPAFNFDDKIFEKRAEINSLTNDYSKLTVYYVTEYKDSSIIDSTNTESNVLSISEVRNSIKKIYHYNFTGLNDQVIDFDLKFNFAFYFDLPNVGGVDQPDGGTSGAGGTTTEQTDYKKNNNDNNKIPPKNFNVAKCLAERKELNRNITTNPAGDATANLIMEGTSSRSYFNSMLDNSMSSNTSGDLININAKVKGDPYWIGASIPVSDDRFYRLKFETKPNDNEETFWDRQSMFLFRAYQSEESDVASGTVARKSNQSNKTISGLYYVIRVKHTFSNGVFEQELEAKRETRVGVKDIDAFINERIGNNT